MVLLQILLGFTLIWISHATYDLARERCVPTAAAYGACHVCVCSMDGVYHCRAHACKGANETDIIKEWKRECEPNRTYREDGTFCSCSKDGLWMSNNCREIFQTMKPNNILSVHKLRTNIECTPNELYLLDCNICECGKKGFIELSSCTNRKCNRGHKVDMCSYGDYLRTYNEICSCSDINLYIDRLCLKVVDTAIQIINRTDLESIIDIGKTWTRSNEIYLLACVPGSSIIIDCNRCFCTNGKTWGCTMKGCVPPKLDMLRSKKQDNEFFSLPTLETENEPCEPGKNYRFKCNSCICTNKKVPMSNPFRSPSHDDLPELRDGEDCTLGEIYRKDCNTCKCGPNNSAMCTKMACLNKQDMDRIKETVKKQKNIEKMENEIKKQNNKSKKYTSRWLPDLPEGECVPGQLYQKNCRGCYCNYNKTAMCVTNKNSCDKHFYPESADAIRPIYSKEEFDALPSLPHIAAKCEPGKSYRVDCNSCVCLINYSLMCDLAMCLSYNDMHNNIAARASNKDCIKGQEVKSPGECVKCSCSNGKTKCEEIPGCLSADEKRRSLHGEINKRRPKLKLEYDEKEKCVGGSIYKLHCNRCYCQDDGSMRCTQKTCLQYAQSLQLKKQRLYLEKHGL